MKHITWKNFDEVFPEFVRDLYECSYVAIDLEFTGIDRSSTIDFLQLPEKAFAEKMAAACQFSPVQIGFGLFQGDTGLEDDAKANGATVDMASNTYRKIMLQEAEAFSTVDAHTQSLRELLMSMASQGSVKNEHLNKLFEARQEAEGACKNNSDDKSIYDQIRAYHILDEVDVAINIAMEWKKNIITANRHVSVKSYSCYLFPAPGEDGEDRTVILSSETAGFLRKNGMDLNMWVSEGLYFVSFDEYAKDRKLLLSLREKTEPLSNLDAKLAALKKWIKSIKNSELEMYLIMEYDQLARFAKTAEEGDTMEWRGPFLKPPVLGMFEHHLRELGLRCARKTIIKQTVLPLRGKNGNSGKEYRYYGTRLLEALVGATRYQNKTLVIHNGLSDLAFLCSVIHKEPPKTLVEFKRIVRDMFPVFYDTRALTCTPSLQYIANLTGPLKKTFLTLHRKSMSIKFYGALVEEVMGEENVKEHNAAFDAFMTGALFAYAQEELAQVGADFRQLRGITPIHGCIFSMMFGDDEKNCMLQSPLASIYLVHRPLGVPLYTDSLRREMMHVEQHIGFIFNAEVCLVTIGGREPNSFDKKEVDHIINEWCNNCGFTLTMLDVESQVKNHNIVYISEMVK